MICIITCIFLLWFWYLNLLLFIDTRGVGFLRYFQVKQLPNFLLASPTLSLAIGSVILYSNLLYKAFHPLRMHRKNDFTLVPKSVETNKSSDAPHASANDMSYNNGQGINSQFFEHL